MDGDMNANLVLTAVEDGVATLTMNRPGARNALSMAMMAALSGALDDAMANPAVRVVVLAGAGPGFCAGHDLKEVRADDRRAAHEALFAACSALMMKIRTAPRPVIARVHGIATAAGCQLVATCDLAVADPGARFATPGVNIGLFCSTPMVALSRAVGRKAAMRMLLTGEMASADEALAMGLISHVAAPGALEAETAALARAIAAKSTMTVATGKAAFYRQVEMPVAAAYDYTSRVMVENMARADAREGIDAFIEKRPPVWTDD